MIQSVPQPQMPCTKRFEHARGPCSGVGDLRVELHRVELARSRRPCRRSGSWGVLAMTLKPGGSCSHLVAVAHPHLEHAVAFVRVEVLECRRTARCGHGRALRRSRTRALPALRPCRPAGWPWSACRSRCPAPARPARTRRRARLRRRPRRRELGPPDRMMPLGCHSCGSHPVVGHVAGMHFAVHLRLRARGGRSAG